MLTCMLDGIVEAAYSIHSIEHMRDLITFMEELYRVCAPGAKVYIRSPYYASRKAFVDSTHVLPLYLQNRCRRYLWNVCEAIG